MTDHDYDVMLVCLILGVVIYALTFLAIKKK